MRLNIHFWGTILYLFIIVFGILICGLSVQLASQLDPPRTPAIGVMQYVAESLLTSPIQDIFITKTADNANIACPQGFELLTLGVWPGNRVGCEMEDFNIVTDSCIMTNIPAKPAREITLWGDTAICVKRNVQYKFGSDITCTENFRKCAQDLCVSKNESCPITNITAVAKTDLTNNSKAEQLAFNDDIIFEISRDYNSPPIFSLEVSIIGNPCLARGRVPERENPYRILEVEFGCGEYGPDTIAAVRLAKMDEVMLYQANNFEDIFTELKGYRENIQNEKVYLVARNRLQLRQLPVCYESHHEKSELENLHSLEVWGQWVFSCVILELTLIIPFIIFLYKDIKRRGILKLLVLAPSRVCVYVAFSYFCVFVMMFVVCFNVYIILKSVDESSRAYGILYENSCFVEEKLMDAAVEFGKIEETVFNSTYQRVTLVLGFGIIRTLSFASVVIMVYVQKKRNRELFNVRNRRETEMMEFVDRGNQHERLYQSI